MNFEEKISKLTPLVELLKGAQGLEEKQKILNAFPGVQQASQAFIIHCFDLPSKLALLSLAAIGQERHLLSYPHGNPPKNKVKALLSELAAIDHFYESIGGIVGYHLTALRMLAKRGLRPQQQGHYTRAPGVDLTQPCEDIVSAGIQALPEIGEVYPIGGLGSRLNLVSKSGDPLPAAFLPFLGRTLLEGLVRDVQAREFLYYRLYGKQVTIPIAMMTSLEKKNDERIRGFCEKKHWLCRPKESFFLFSQLSVPVINAQGEWVMHEPLKPLLQPGGHGALWRTAEEKRVFDWFSEKKKHRLLIRQINNPIAGTDHGLLALLGVGKKEQKAFGFASCERLPHAAEGVLVLKKEGQSIHLSNIEYTDFEKCGIEDRPEKNGFSPYPANTNILYADIDKLRPVIKKNPLPGLILNMKNTVLHTKAGRLESMMQNITDNNTEALATFLTYNERRRTISATKRSFEAGKELLETPEGAFYDLLYNAHVLLKECGMEVSDFCTPETYLREGPSHLFLYHPALGPLYALIAQKIRNGRFAENAELQLEIADLKMEALDLEGSLNIHARNTLGHLSQGILCYSQQTGKCVLKGVKVENKGVDRTAENCYWKNQVKRREALTILLEGHSEFYAEDIVFKGSQTIRVPDGERWIANPDGTFHKESAGWEWGHIVSESSFFTVDE